MASTEHEPRPSAPASAPGPDHSSSGWHVDSPGVGNAVMERLQDVGKLSRVIEQRFSAALGINPTGLTAMENLTSDGPLTARELADRLRVTTAASTQIVDRLERAGHVSRRPHATDRRKVLVEPAEKSMTQIVDYLRPLLSGVESLVDELSPEDRDVVESFLAGVVQLYAATADSLSAH